MSEQTDKLARLETLINQIDKLEGQQPAAAVNETAQIANMLEQILIKVETIQAQKAKQEEANKKLEQVLAYMESTIGQGTLAQVKPGKLPIEDTLKDFLRTAQSSGKVLELLAGSLVIVLEAAVNVVKNNSLTPVSLAPGAKTSNPQTDFTSILSALSSYVQGLNAPGK